SPKVVCSAGRGLVKQAPGQADECVLCDGKCGSHAKSGVNLTRLGRLHAKPSQGFIGLPEPQWYRIESFACPSPPTSVRKRRPSGEPSNVRFVVMRHRRTFFPCWNVFFASRTRGARRVTTRT